MRTFVSYILPNMSICPLLYNEFFKFLVKYIFLKFQMLNAVFHPLTSIKSYAYINGPQKYKT